MSPWDLYSVIVGHVVEGAPCQMRKQTSREPHGAESPAHETIARCTVHLVRNELPVELRVVCDKHVALERGHHLRSDHGKDRSVLDHVPADVGQLADEVRYGALGVHQRLIHLAHFPIANDHRGELSDSVHRPPAAGRLHVHNRVGKSCERLWRKLTIEILPFAARAATALIIWLCERLPNAKRPLSCTPVVW